MNSRAKSEFNLFLQNMMSDPDFCKSPVNSKWCNLFNEVLEIYKVNPDDIPARRNLLKESGENSHSKWPSGMN